MKMRELRELPKNKKNYAENLKTTYVNIILRYKLLHYVCVKNLHKLIKLLFVSLSLKL